MVDITLSSERIRTAPLEVRRWIENELAESIGLSGAGPLKAGPANVAHDRLVACSTEELACVLDLVHGAPSVVHVFLELGRAGTRHLPGNVEMRHLIDVAEHARLQATSQVAACIKTLNEALQEVRGDIGSLLCAVDEDDRCYVAAVTQEGIHALWQSLIVAASKARLASDQQKQPEVSCAPPYTVEAQGSRAEPAPQAV